MYPEPEPLPFELQERAEDYSLEAIGHFCGNNYDLSYQILRVHEFLKSEERQILHIYTERGRGKTFLARIALAMWEGEAEYCSYFKSRRMPSKRLLQTDDILVVDDIHYMVDDMRDGKIKTNDVVMLLVAILERAVAGKKTIILSEDVFTEDYIPNVRYRNIRHHFCNSKYCSDLPIIKSPTEAIFKTLGRNPRDEERKTQKFIKFLDTINPTPRGITAFITKFDANWNTLMEIAISAYVSKPDIYNHRIARKTTNAMRWDRLKIQEQRIGNKLSVLDDMYHGNLPKDIAEHLSKNSRNMIKHNKMQGNHNYIWSLYLADIKLELDALLFLVFSNFALSKQGYYKELRKRFSI